MGKKLIPNETIINDEVEISYKGKDYTIPLFYGNVTHLPTGQEIHLNEADYMTMLEEFLMSDEGSEYDEPSEDEIYAAIDACLSKTKQTKRTRSKPEPEEEKAPEPVEAPVDSTGGSEEEEPEFEPEENKSEKKKGLKLPSGIEAIMRRNSNQEPEAPVENEDGSQEPVKREVLVQTKILRVKDERKLTAYRLISALLLVTAIVLGLGLFNIIPINPAEHKTYSLITLTRNIPAGSVLSMDDFRIVDIPSSQYESVTRKTYVNDEQVGVAYPVLWASRTTAAGKYVVSDLKEGEYLMTGDFTDLKAGVNSVEVRMDEDTTVMIPVSATAAGTSDVRLYAIITTVTSGGNVTNTAVNLGELSFEGKALTDLLNEKGVSLVHPAEEQKEEVTEAEVAEDNEETTAEEGAEEVGESSEETNN